MRCARFEHFIANFRISRTDAWNFSHPNDPALCETKKVSDHLQIHPRKSRAMPLQWLHDAQDTKAIEEIAAREYLDCTQSYRNFRF